jgi:hypothetical protein
MIGYGPRTTSARRAARECSVAGVFDANLRQERSLSTSKPSRLGFVEATTWAIRKANYKVSGLSAAIIDRMLMSHAETGESLINGGVGAPLAGFGVVSAAVAGSTERAGAGCRSRRMRPAHALSSGCCVSDSWRPQARLQCVWLDAENRPETLSRCRN